MRVGHLYIVVGRIEKFAKLEGNMIYMGIFVVIIVVCSSICAIAYMVAE